MDNNLQDKLNLLKIGYLKKLEGTIPEFKVLSDKINVSLVDELYSKVHAISGTSGMYGLKELSDFSADFELYLKRVKSGEICYEDDVLKGLLIKYIDQIINITKGDING